MKGVSILGFSTQSSARNAGMVRGDVIIEYNGVRNLTGDTLSALTGATRAEGSQNRVIFMRNGREYSAVVPPGSLGISALDTVIETFSKQQRPGGRISKIVMWIHRAHLVLALLFFGGAVASFVLMPVLWGGLVTCVLFIFLALLCLHSDVFLQRSLREYKGGILGAVIGALIGETIRYAILGPEGWHSPVGRVPSGICIALGVYLGYMIVDRKTPDRLR